jgi:hypothetical protein
MRQGYLDWPPGDEPTPGDPFAWEWIGSDGLTDSQRALKNLREADMLPDVKLEELPD